MQSERPLFFLLPTLYDLNSLNDYQRARDFRVWPLAGEWPLHKTMTPTQNILIQNKTESIIVLSAARALMGCLQSRDTESRYTSSSSPHDAKEAPQAITSSSETPSPDGRLADQTPTQNLTSIFKVSLQDLSLSRGTGQEGPPSSKALRRGRRTSMDEASTSKGSGRERSRMILTSAPIKLQLPPSGFFFSALPALEEEKAFDDIDNEEKSAENLKRQPETI